jgi:hypothetical protein
MLMSHHQSTGQNHNIKIPNKLFEGVEKFKYLGTMINEDYINQKIKY